jgi:hypothetical protein
MRKIAQHLTDGVADVLERGRVMIRDRMWS